MEIRLPKPSCPCCKSSNIKTSSNNTYYECNNCGYDDSIDIVWEEVHFSVIVKLASN